MNMLMDVLGVVFAFASVMLFFSLLVTMVVHAIQATLNVRYYNLKHGVDLFLESTRIASDQINKSLTDKILSTPFENGSILKIKRTSLSQQELIDKIKTHVPSPVDVENATQYIDAQFAQFESYLSERYTRISHMLSLGVALLVVLAFQIHAFDLLKNIANDAETRARYSEFGTQALQAGSENTLAVSKDLSAASSEETKARKEQMISQLQLFNFSLLPEGRNYFYQSEKDTCKGRLLDLLGRYIGLIASAILISLGAPFWFNTLQSVASLKDKLAEYKKVIK